MTKKPPDAPWKFIHETRTFEDGEYTVYMMGGEGKKALENAMCRTQCHQARYDFERDIKELKSMLDLLTDLIGGPDAMVEYFRKYILIQLKDKSRRTGDLTVKPYSAFRYVALAQLLKEDKIIHTRNGWWKLGTI